MGRKAITLLDISARYPDWRQMIYDTMSTGRPVRSAFLVLGISYMTHCKLMKDEEEYRNAFAEGMVACEQWWVEKGIQGLSDKSMQLGFFVWMTKSILNWRETKERQPNGKKNLDDVEEDMEITNKYSKPKAKEIVLN